VHTAQLKVFDESGFVDLSAVFESVVDITARTVWANARTIGWVKFLLFQKLMESFLLNHYLFFSFGLAETKKIALLRA
jgi:hypothetical protein